VKDVDGAAVPFFSGFALGRAEYLTQADTGGPVI
jgi:hypothetical protein